MNNNEENKKRWREECSNLDYGKDEYFVAGYLAARRQAQGEMQYLLDHKIRMDSLFIDQEKEIRKQRDEIQKLREQLENEKTQIAESRDSQVSYVERNIELNDENIEQRKELKQKMGEILEIDTENIKLREQLNSQRGYNCSPEIWEESLLLKEQLQEKDVEIALLKQVMKDMKELPIVQHGIELEKEIVELRAQLEYLREFKVQLN